MRAPRPILPPQWWGVPLAVLVVVVLRVVEWKRQVRSRSAERRGVFRRLDEMLERFLEQKKEPTRE